MREFLYYSTRAVTSGSILSKASMQGDLMKAGRMDIACQMVIMCFFISNQMRENVKLHLVFHGGPDPPKHLEMYPGKNMIETKEEKNNLNRNNDERIELSKKDIAGLIKKMLYKYKEGKKTEVAPGYHVEKKHFIDVVKELVESGKNVYILSERGEDIRKKSDEEIKNSVFIIGGEEGMPKKEIKKIKSLGAKTLSVGSKVYFASQTTTIVHNELDRRGIE